MGSKIKHQFIGKLAVKNRSNPHLSSLYVFNGISLVAGTIYGLYYGVFLYKNTFSLSVLALDGLIGGVGVWLGYVVGVALIRRHGFTGTIRIAFVLWATVALITAFVTNHIAEWFMLLALVRTLPAGLYKAVTDTIMLGKVRHTERGNFLQLNLALEFAVSIVLPSMVGALISVSGGYQWAFIVAAAVYALALLYRVSLPRPDLHFTMYEVLQTFRRPLYGYQAFNRTLAAGFNQLNAFALTIIPFLLLHNELSMGLVSSLAAVAAALFALKARHMKSRRQLGFGYSAYLIRGLAAVLFVAFWTAPLMIVWQVIGKLMTPFHDPLQQSLDIHNDALIMGPAARQKSLQINLLNNTLALFGTLIAFGGFLLIMHTDATQQRIILPVLIVAYAAWRFVNLGLSHWMNQVLLGTARRWSLRQAAAPYAAIVGQGLLALRPWL